MCHNLAWFSLCKLNSLQSEKEEKERESGLGYWTMSGSGKGEGEVKPKPTLVRLTQNGNTRQAVK